MLKQARTILFVGCSFTYGSGLQYEYLYKKGHSPDEFNKDINATIPISLDYKADEYRKQHNWPNLVAKELNKPFIHGTYCNAGSNICEILGSIKHTNLLTKASVKNSIELVVVQFTDWLRDVDRVDKEYITIQEFIDTTIMNQVKQVVDACEELVDESESSWPKWVGLSWREDIGNYLKKHYPDNFIPIQYKGKEYVSFDYISDYNQAVGNSTALPIEEGLRLCDSIPGLEDYHLNSKGCKVIANSILRKLNI